MGMLVCEVYAAVTLTITTIWVYSGRNYALRTLALAMFFPGLFAPWFSDDPHFFRRLLGFENVYGSLVYSLVAVLCVVVMAGLTVAIDLATGWGRLVEKPNFMNLGSDFVSEFLRAAGEEVGWRCYLLPSLLTYYSTAQSLFIGGLIWALFHAPFMVLLTGRLHVEPRWLTILVQSASCIVFSMTIGWLAIKSGFSLWAPTMYHFAWNNLIPVLFGSIYTQKPGKLIFGDQWLINGEGLAGTLAGLIMAGAVLWDLGILSF